MRSLHVRASIGVFHLTSKAFESAMFDLIEHCGLHVRRAISYEFFPDGITAVAILAESHIILSTWPEKHDLQLDFFCCGDTSAIDRMLGAIPEKLNCKIVSSRVLDRDSMVSVPS